MLHTLFMAPANPLTSPVEALVEKLEGWGATGIDMLPNAVVALVTVVLSWMLAGVVSRWVCKGVDRTHASPQLRDLIASLSRFTTIVLGVVLALNAMELDRAVATALAGVGVVGLALGFAFQDIAANLMSGVLMAIKQPFAVGESIETNGFSGTVEHVGLRATELRKFTGELVLIPNRKIFSESLTNVSAAELRRVDIAVGVSYADDLDVAERVATEAVAALEECSDDKDVQVLYRAFGASSVDLEVRFWVPYGADAGSYLRGHSNAIKAIKRAFDEAKLSIPFPIRTLDFGVDDVGGVGLEEQVTALLAARREAS